jgi:FixJ family two-component response regulator
MTSRESHRADLHRAKEPNVLIKAEPRAMAVVVDDSAVRDSLLFLLEAIGYPVETFAPAAEFLEAQKRSYAYLILDHQMPDIRGLELAERLRAHGTRITVLLMTGLPSHALTVRAGELGIDMVLETPFDDEDLVECISALRRL